jgi:putative ATP-dependent endonuclease of the OLD family
MFLERITLTGFRCFSATPARIEFVQQLTAFVGSNGSGKTAVMIALQRLFGITAEQRRIRRQDFHVPVEEREKPPVREFKIEAVISFPELNDPNADHSKIPDFFHHMATNENGALKCRFLLTATLTEDGSLEGAIDYTFVALQSFDDSDESEPINLKAVDRAHIQMIYVPASRDGASQVTAFLRGRLWRAANWSPQVRSFISTTATKINENFRSEAAVDHVSGAVKSRWQQVHSGGTDTTPLFQPVELEFEEFIRKVEVVFHPAEDQRTRSMDELSDGQRSLFHIAMTAATLDVEAKIAADPTQPHFIADGIAIPALTLICIEEPENNLAPFYLSRIIRQVEELTSGLAAQAMISSHSASILSRVDPTQIRHFHLSSSSRVAQVRSIRVPVGDEEASKFVREAVRAYPELYFARAVILGEGASEEVVLPRIAEALGLEIDRSFVAVVPLGGRHVNHLWRLLTDLNIPFRTLLDLDRGREGGGWGRIKNAVLQLLATGTDPVALLGNSHAEAVAALDQQDPADHAELTKSARWLRTHGVYFAEPLDLDYSMLAAFPAYKTLESGRTGPSPHGDPRVSVLGDNGQPALYDATHDESLRWYRYLFLGRGKPSTHVRVLSTIPNADLAANAPSELRDLLADVARIIAPPAPPPPPPRVAPAPVPPLPTQQ